MLKPDFQFAKQSGQKLLTKDMKYLFLLLIIGALTVRQTASASHEINQPEITLINTKALALYERRENKMAEMLLLKLDSIVGNNPVDSAAAYGYFLLGNVSYRLRKGKEALKWHKKSLSWRETNLSRPHLQIIQSNEWIGNVYRYTLRQPYDAIPYYEQALGEAELDSALDKDAHRRLTYHLSASYRLVKDMGQAFRYGLKSLQLAEGEPNNKDQLASHLNQIGTLYVTDGQPGKAIKYFVRALTQLPPDKHLSTRRFRYRSNLADANHELGNYEAAQAVQLESLTILKGQDEINPEVLGTLYHTLAKGANKMNETNALDRYAQLALDTYINGLGNNHPRVAEIYRYWGSAYRHTPNRSLPLLDSSLQILWPAWGLGKGMSSVFPKSTDWEALFIALGHRAFTLRYLKPEGAENRLDESLVYHQKALEAYQTYRFSFLAKEGIIGQAEQHAWLLEEALETVEMAITTQSSSWTLQELHGFAWQLIEAGKSALLLQSVQQSKAQDANLLPDSVFQTYRLLTYQLEKFRQNPDLGIDSLYKAQRAWTKWLNQVKVDFPQYSRFLRQSQPTGLAATMKAWQANKLILNYWVGRHAIYVVGARVDKVALSKIPLDQKLKNSIQEFLSFVRHPRPEQIDSNSAKDGLHAGYVLNQKLVAPFLKEQTTSVLVIPHGILEQLPFNAFLTEQVVVTSPLNYHSHPFLIRKTAIHYAFSGAYAEFSNQRLQKERVEYESNFVGLAWGTSSDSNSDFAPLPKSAEEVQQAAMLWNGIAYTDAEATESRLRNSLQEAKVVHLAVHGVERTETDTEPKLILPVADSIHDGQFRLSELYQIAVKSDLVILSACQTAQGNYSEGEGTMSMSRGFAFSGCPSIISGLWPLYDGSTSRLMTLWYQSIVKGQPLEISLQKSTKKYLNEVSPLEAHPSYWAGVVLVGANDLSLTDAPGDNLLLWFFALLIFSFVVLIALKSKV